ncbi:2-hydroxyacyl-CoA dehydratase [Pseudonocardia sp. DLS-67]
MSMPAALGALREAYDGARTGAGPDPARPRVGCIGLDVPVEVVLAAGMTPIRLPGLPGQATPDGDRYLGRGADPEIRSQLQSLLDGRYGALDRLLITHDREGMARLYYALRALHRFQPERTAALPHPYFVDVLHMPWRSTGRYNWERGRQLRRELGDPDDAALRSAAALVNATRRRLRELRTHRRASRIGGEDALRVIGAQTALPQERYRQLLDALLDDLPDAPPRPGRRIFLTGSGHDHPGWYTLIEGCGAVVVGEDHEWGDAVADGDVDEAAPDPLVAIMDRYHHRAPLGAKSTVAVRAAHTARQARLAGAEGVICVIRHGDPGPRWDVPDQCRALGDIPLLLLDDQPYEATPGPGLRTTISGFLAGLPERAR